MNLLAGASSPYLRQHADNPVQWRPWGQEALDEAAEKDVPLFVSLGYASCHWCHVMAHESFEHQDVAELLNTQFVPVKVDREERPDLDALLMKVTQLITGRGGWPNSVFLFPDQRPFFAGMYWPREDSLQQMGFVSVLRELARLWQEERPRLEEQTQRLMDPLSALCRSLPPTTQTKTQPILDLLLDEADEERGGFGGAPKFPPHQRLLWLLDQDREERIDRMLSQTLDAMALGGMHDQAGGAFHRYATDEQWILPHFEIMLFDNAQLLEIYSRAAARFDSSFYAQVARGIVSAFLRDFQVAEGLFASSTDADTPEGEGAQVVWSAAELKQELGGDYADFADFFGIQEKGNLWDEATGRATGKNILLPRENPYPLWKHRLEQLCGRRAELHAQPARDDKVILEWNALWVSALFEAERSLGEPAYGLLARECLLRILNQLRRPDGRWLRCRLGDQHGPPAVLEDVAALALALDRAGGYEEELKDLLTQLEQFFSEADGAYVLSDRREGSLLYEQVDVFDSDRPAALGLIAQLFARRNDPRFQRLMKRLQGWMHREALACLSLWRAQGMQG